MADEWSLLAIHIYIVFKNCNGHFWKCMLTSIRNVKFYIKWNTMFITAVGITNYKNFYGLRPGKRIQHLLPTSVRFCWRMLTGSGGPTSFNTSSAFDSTKPRRSLVFSARLQPRWLLWIWSCYYGNGHGDVIERPISAHAHTQQCWKKRTNGFNFTQHSR